MLYLIAVAGGLVFYWAYREWLSWVFLLLLVLTPLFSLLCSLPAMLTCRTRFQTPDSVASGTEVDAISNNGETALMIACRQYKSESIVRDLISYGADVNAKSKFGLTPLMIAKQSGRTEVVEILKAHGAQE
jgi:hypothetical protein